MNTARDGYTHTNSFRVCKTSDSKPINKYLEMFVFFHTYVLLDGSKAEEMKGIKLIVAFVRMSVNNMETILFLLSKRSTVGR